MKRSATSRISQVSTNRLSLIDGVRRLSSQRRESFVVPLDPAGKTVSPPLPPAPPPLPFHRRDDFRWIVAGGCILAFAAGWLNIFNMVVFGHGITHVTGTVTTMGSSIVTWNSNKFFQALLTVICFAVGSGISGYIVGSDKFQLGNHYGTTMMVVGSMVLFATIAIRIMSSSTIKQYPIETAFELLLSTASGMQNALCTSYSGAVIRTTHMTGITTDIGLVIGHWIKYRKYGFFEMKNSVNNFELLNL